MNPALQTSDDSSFAAQVEDFAPPAGGAPYDAARERSVARKLRNARWRRLVLLFSAVAVAGAAAGGFTMANKEALLAAASHVPAETREAAAPAVTQPSLASSASRPVQLPGAETDPNKVQARVVMPADPEPPAPASAPMQMQDSQPTGPRTIPLGGGGRVAAAADSASGEATELPAGAMGFAPVPAPRPSRAP